MLKFFQFSNIFILALFISLGSTNLAKAQESETVLAIKQSYEKKTGKVWMDATSEEKKKFIDEFKREQNRLEKERHKEEMARKQQVLQKERARILEKRKKEQIQRAKDQALKEKLRKKAEKRRKLKSKMNSVKTKMKQSHRKR